jgi:hypothetical protein
VAVLSVVSVARLSRGPRAPGAESSWAACVALIWNKRREIPEHMLVVLACVGYAFFTQSLLMRRVLGTAKQVGSRRLLTGT